MIVAKVQCSCNYYVRIRTLPDPGNPRHEYGWVKHTHNNGCGRKLEIERKGGRGARVVGKCEGVDAKVIVEYEE